VSPSDVRTRLRADLVAAMKARRPEVVGVLRSAVAALDNAEAVESAGPATDPSSVHVAGSRAGVGSTEASRRRLTDADIASVLRGEVDARITEAERYDDHGQHDAAARLRREAEVLRGYLAPN
jgi:uncharacterized protein YqeY